MDSSRRRANRSAGRSMESYHFLDVIRVIPVVGIEERHSVEPLIHRCQATYRTRRVADIVVSFRQDDMFHGANGGQVLWVPVRDEVMRAMVRLPGNAEETRSEQFGGFFIVRRDHRNAAGTGLARRHDGFMPPRVKVLSTGDPIDDNSAIRLPFYGK